MARVALPGTDGYLLVDTRKGTTVPLAAARATTVDVLGAPLAAWTIASVALPAQSRAEEQQTARLQCAYHLPFASEDGWVRSSVADAEDGGRVLTIVGIAKADLPAARMILPRPLALLGLARQTDSLGDGANLLVHLGAKDVLTTMVLNGRVVFMRAFPRHGDATAAALVQDLHLSAQQVYDVGERRALTPARTVLFGAVPDDLRQVLDSAGLGEIQQPPVPAPSDEARLAGGLAALATARRKLRTWDVVRREVDLRAAVCRGLIASLPFWGLFIVLWYYGDLVQVRRARAAVEGKMRALAPAYRQVLAVDQEVTAMEDFMDADGPGWNSVAYWRELLRLCEAHRPFGMRLTTLSGRLEGTVTVSGQAASYEDVNDYLQKLAAEKLLQDPTLAYSQAREGRVDFQFTCKLAPVTAELAEDQARQTAADGGDSAGSASGGGEEAP